MALSGSPKVKAIGSAPALAWSATIKSLVIYGSFGRSSEEHRKALAAGDFAAVHGLDQKAVKDRPGDIGVADLPVALGGIGDVLLRPGQRRADGHEARENIGPTGVDLNPAFAEDILALHDQLALDRQIVIDLPRRGEPLDDKLPDRRSVRAGVDPDIDDIVACSRPLDQIRLPLEV